MKRICLFIILFLLMTPVSVNASNKIYRIDMDIYLNEDGSADITETWDVDGEDGTEWYKVMNNLGNSKLSNFAVSMDGEELSYKYFWDVDESLDSKKGRYGINHTEEGLELCFGKYDYERHTFVLSYTLSNFVFSTSDNQVIYFKLIDKLTNVDFDKFSVTVSGYYEFSSTLPVWAFGYNGVAKVENGKILMYNSKGNMNGDYVVLLAKFPFGTFTNVDNTVEKYSVFDDVLKQAKEGTFFEKIAKFAIILLLLFGMVAPIAFSVIFLFIPSSVNYGYKDNKKIDKKNVPIYRDIPCNKDIYYANILIKLNNFGYKKSNIFGAIILKWVRDNKIKFKNVKKGIFDRESSVLDLNSDVTFDNDLEAKLFKMMKTASKDGLLEAKEFEKWCNKNSDKFLKIFNRIEDDKIKSLKGIYYIYKRKRKRDCEYPNIMNDIIYKDSVELYGLKKYLKEFSKIDTKEVMEVKLWEEYLMFAYLFGIADKVAEQLKHMYPEVVVEMQKQNFDFDMIKYVNNISTRSFREIYKSNSSSRSSSSGYSSGGGGYSSYRGGSGSFGGGGGGSR